MYLLRSGRGGGKTHAAIDWLFEDVLNRRIMCADQVRAQHVRAEVLRRFRKAGLYGFSIAAVKQMVVVASRDDPLRGQPHVSVCVDDVEDVIQQLLRCRIEFATSSAEVRDLPTAGSALEDA